MKTIYSVFVYILFALFVVCPVNANNDSVQYNGLDQVRSEISSKTISIDIRDTSFREVINLIRQRVSFNIVIDKSSYKNVDQDVTISFDEVTIKQALKIILDMNDLSALFKNGVVHIKPKQNARQYEIRFYDVRDVQYELKDFPGPELRFRNNQQSKQSIQNNSKDRRFIGPGIFDRNQVNANKDIITDEQSFMKLIRKNVGTEGRWKGKPSMRMTGGILVVNQTPEIHKQISFLINRLRQFK